jgi:hypothetical protein
MIRIFLFLALSFLISCTTGQNPLSREEVHRPATNCYITGLKIDFADTCSYDFVMNFLSDYDSVTVTDSYLGDNFYLYADSGDYNYWYNYFAGDSTVQLVHLVRAADSLILKITVSGEKPRGEESQRFQQIRHLQIISIEKYPGHVYVTVPEKSEESWCTYFRQFTFILSAVPVGLCTES